MSTLVVFIILFLGGNKVTGKKLQFWLGKKMGKLIFVGR